MAVRTTTTFDPSNVGLITLQYKGTENEGTIDVLDCIGMMQAETTVRTKTKTCSGATKDEKSYPQFLTVTATAYVGLETMRTLTGMHNEGLKAGVYAYGLASKAPSLVVTARLLDDMEDLEKIVAFPNASVSRGLAFTVDNDTDEVAKVDLEFKAMLDEKGNFYYEKEVKDESDVESWEAGFTTSLVEGA